MALAFMKPSQLRETTWRPPSLLLPLPVRWSQGEHLSLIGQTKSGKSTLATVLLLYREWLIVYRSKTDPARQPIHYPVQAVIRTSALLTSQKYSRFELRPKYEEQGPEFADALDKTWRWGGFCNYLDETLELDEELKLRPLIRRLMTQGSGKGVTMVCGLQRPVGVSRYVMSQSLHVISFGIESGDLRELADKTSKRFAEVCMNLPKYWFAWYTRGDHKHFVGKLNLRTQQIEGSFV